MFLQLGKSLELERSNVGLPRKQKIGGEKKKDLGNLVGGMPTILGVHFLGAKKQGPKFAGKMRRIIQWRNV